PYPAIQLFNYNWIGAPVFPVFPFGGAFARNGDILHTTFIGSYQIRDVAQPRQQGVGTAAPDFTELNAVAIDSALADDQDPNEDAIEQIGRFCPITGAGIDDFDITGSYATTWRYHFGGKLLDYLTVQSPPSDYEP